MKNKLFTFLSIIMLLTLLCSCNAGNKDINNKDENQVVKSNKAVYETSEAIINSFLQICKDGDIEKMYDIYYDDFLTKMLEDSQSGMDKETFDGLLKEEMQSIQNSQVYRYGSLELLDNVSPFHYVNYHYSMIYGKDIPLENGDELVTDCTVLRVYMNDGSYGDHVFIEIDGHWFAAI